MPRSIPAFVIALAASVGASHVSNAASKITSECGATQCDLRFDGPIVKGDAKDIEREILRSPRVINVNFNSPGGNPFEALLIADVLNKYFVKVWVDELAKDICASACAYMFLAANQRYGADVYLHRPSFPPAMFAALSAENAQLTYRSVTKALINEMRMRGIPEAEIELAMSIPSGSVVRIRDGYPTYSPWLEEWLAAKCRQNSRPTNEHANSDLLKELNSSFCELDALVNEAERTQKNSGGR